MTEKIHGFDVVVYNKYNDDEYIMFAIAAPNTKIAKILAIRDKERASEGATRKRKYIATIENGPYNLKERNLKNKIGIQKVIGGDYY